MWRITAIPPRNRGNDATDIKYFYCYSIAFLILFALYRDRSQLVTTPSPTSPKSCRSSTDRHPEEDDGSFPCLKKAIKRGLYWSNASRLQVRGCVIVWRRSPITRSRFKDLTGATESILCGQRGTRRDRRRPSRQGICDTITSFGRSVDATEKNAINRYTCSVNDACHDGNNLLVTTCLEHTGRMTSVVTQDNRPINT